MQITILLNNVSFSYNIGMKRESGEKAARCIISMLALVTTMKIPSKADCFFILEMLESKLIDFSYTEAWADKLILELEVAPSWLCDIAIKKYQGAQIKSIREYIFGEPFEAEPTDMEKFYVACLWLRYERREISWATFLDEAGSYLDAASGDWDCETPYHYLNMYEDAYFTNESEEGTKKLYLKDHDLVPWIELARKKFEPFKKLRKANKSIKRIGNP